MLDFFSFILIEIQVTVVPFMKIKPPVCYILCEKASCKPC